MNKEIKIQTCLFFRHSNKVSDKNYKNKDLYQEYNGKE